MGTSTGSAACAGVVPATSASTKAATIHNGRRNICYRPRLRGFFGSDGATHGRTESSEQSTETRVSENGQSLPGEHRPPEQPGEFRVADVVVRTGDPVDAADHRGAVDV